MEKKQILRPQTWMAMKHTQHWKT